MQHWLRVGRWMLIILASKPRLFGRSSLLICQLHTHTHTHTHLDTLDIILWT